MRCLSKFYERNNTHRKTNLRSFAEFLQELSLKKLKKNIIQLLMLVAERDREESVSGNNSPKNRMWHITNGKSNKFSSA